MINETIYDDELDPCDYADFLGIEDRDDLADLQFEPCDYCGGEIRVLGGYGLATLIECRACRIRLLLKPESDDGDDDEWDEEGEEGGW